MQEAYGMCWGPGSDFWWCLKLPQCQRHSAGLADWHRTWGPVAAGSLAGCAGWGRGGAALIPG